MRNLAILTRLTHPTGARGKFAFAPNFAVERSIAPALSDVLPLAFRGDEFSR